MIRLLVCVDLLQIAIHSTHIRTCSATFSPRRVYSSRQRRKPLQGAPPMNRLLLSPSLALALSYSPAFAQQQQDAAPAPTTKHHHAHNPQREAAKLSKKLNLSADQTAKLEPILADRDNKIATLTNDTTISPAVMKHPMRAIRHHTRHHLATVLTPAHPPHL